MLAPSYFQHHIHKKLRAAVGSLCRASVFFRNGSDGSKPDSFSAVLRGAEVRDGNAWGQYILETLELFGDEFSGDCRDDYPAGRVGKGMVWSKASKVRTGNE